MSLIKFRPPRIAMFLLAAGLTCHLLLPAGILGSFPLPALGRACILAGFIINFEFLPHEESRMEQIFGEAFLSYKRKVRRWI